MKFRHFLLSSAFLMLSACGGDSEDATTPVARANGKAYLHAPLVGATVQLHDAKGRPVETTGSTTTTTSGTFSFPIAVRKTERLRVSIAGGTLEGKPFDGKLLLEVENFDADRDLLYVNAVTTLVSQYVKRNPSASIAEASAKVYGFLGVPNPSRSGFIMDNPHQNHFRHEVMMRDMQASGSANLNRYLDSLIDKMNAGTAQRRFTVEGAGSVTETIQALVGNLASNLGNQLFSWAFQSILKALGLGGNAEILNELHEINAKLDELLNLVTALEADAKEIELQTAAEPVLAAISDITGQYRYLTWAAQHSTCAKPGAPTPPSCTESLNAIKQSIRDRMVQILDSNTGVIYGFELMNTALLPSNSSKGVLPLWRDYLNTTKQFYGPITDPRLLKLNEYYETVQVMAAHLIIEAYMAREQDGKPLPDRVSAQLYLSELQNAVKAQEDAVATLNSGNNDVMLDQGTKLTWLRAPISNLMTPQLFEGHHGSTYLHTYDEQADSQCRALAQSNFAGYGGWRLPTESELHAVIRNHPGKGDANSKDGVIAWLLGQGFLGAPGNGALYQRGFLSDTAYFSSTRTWASYENEALWDGGVDNACTVSDRNVCWHNIAPIAGVWCVTDEGARQ